MKKFLLTVFTFICVTINAQLDTEHWFAPMAARTGLSAPQSFFYLSTNETTPFQIDIYSGNVFYMSTTVSKNNPVQFIVPADYMMIANQNFIMNVSNKGFYLKGEKKFYATFRFSITNHAEIITSKGLAGLGTKFYAAMAPLTAQNDFTNSTIGVTATENNTTVTVSGYNPAVVFADGTSSPTKTFTLNKGQSYILETVSLDGIANLTGLVGAKIESDKPISVTNGNYNGFYINQPYNGADILMDQSVPVERLGKDFVVVKGNGPISSQMEKVLIVATEDNTTYSVNGVASGVTLNAGQYKLIESGSYINQGGNHYNIGISSTKNIYVYQLLAGVSSGTITATGGFNYIPPVNCFLPNKVDEIGMINKIGNTVYDTKLNIITQSGATVTLNGNAIASSDGPYPVSGNPNWVSYSVPNVSGNITVNSTKSVTAGIIGGSGAVGYGGFFSGFSTVPSIVKTGDCFTGITLQVDSSFDSYQWYLNGVAIPGATTYFINPELYGAGNYTCSITKNNCDTKVTPVYNYVSCPPIVTTTFDIGNCNTKIITPALTNSTQQINQSQTLITSQPSLGTVSVNNVTGQISYTPVPGLINDVTDSFSYYIEGNGSPAAFQYFQVNFNIDVLQVNNATVTTCNTIGTTGIFDLTSASVTTDPGATVTYYSNPGLTVPISVPTSYSSPAGVAYAKIISMYGCFNSALLTLTVNPTPNINTANFNANLCDDNLDGTINVDFSTITPQIVTNPGSFSVKYYLDQADANIGNNNILPIIWSYSTNTTVYVRVESIAGCPPLFGQINFTIGNKIALSTQDFSTFVCDTNWDVTENVDLNNYKNNFSTDPAVSVTFYSTLANAQNATGAIAANQTISPTQVFYLRFQSTAGCANVAKLTLTLDQLTANNASINACAGATGQALFDLTAPVLTTAPGATVTYFSDAALSIPISVPTAYPSAGGTVYAKVTSQYGCSKVTLITLSVNPSPNINTANFNANLCDDNLDGIININFADVTPQIVTNAANFTVKYYLIQADATIGNNNNLPVNWTYTANTTVYVRVESANGCPPAFGQINFTIGNKITLLTQDYSTLVCDTNWDATENVDLNNYKNNFTTDPAVSLTFYSTLANAQNATGAIAANQTIAPSQIFYVRFQNTNGCPNVAKLTLTLDQITTSNTTMSACAGTNGQAVFNLTAAAVTTTPGAILTYFTDSALTTQIPLPTAYSSTGGTVYVKVTSTFGCSKTAQVTLIVNPLPNINTANFNGAVCDDNLDGTVNITFSTITPQIVNNPANFTVKYYLTAAAATAGGNNNLPNNWTYTANTTVYVRVESANGCPPAFGQINFTIGAKITLLTNNVITQVCDLDLNGSESVNLNDYKNLFTTDPSVSLSFHTTLANAQNGTAPVNAVQNITASQIYFVRFTSSNGCPAVGQISITLITGKKSDVLKNLIVCPGQRTVLDAGPGFTSYLWNTGATTQSITVGEGNYYVDLGFNGCVYRQNVAVTNAVLPTITSITVTAGTATINVSGGTPPYQYSINGFDYQTSNIFTGLQRGPYKIYVKSADGCEPVVKDFLIINLINAITPNGDGHNDYLDYTDLQIKQDVSIEVVDRYGAPLFKSSGKNYKWDGKAGNRNLPTGTYWYIIKWTEPDTKLPVSYSGWLLIKNRE